jgi:hypothetical protein
MTLDPESTCCAVTRATPPLGEWQALHDPLVIVPGIARDEPPVGRTTTFAPSANCWPGAGTSEATGWVV